MSEKTRKCFKCGLSPADDDSISLYRFPKPGKTNILRCESWAKYCFPESLKWSSKEFQAKLHSEHRMLCSKHFREGSFIDFSTRRLHKFAVPEDEVREVRVVIAVPGSSRTSLPLSDITNTAPDLAMSVAEVAQTSITPEYRVQATMPSQPFDTIASTSSGDMKQVPSKAYRASVKKEAENEFRFVVPVPGPSYSNTLIADITHTAPDPSIGVSEISTPAKNVAQATLHSLHFETIASTSSGSETLRLRQRASIQADHTYAKSKEGIDSKKTLKDKKLYLKCRNQMKKICQLRNRIKNLKTKKFLKNLNEDDSVNDLIKKKMSPTFALLLQSQIRNFKRKLKARRWTLDDKITSLRLFKRSPTCYRLLRRLFCLPAPSTLKSLLRRFSLKVGINEKIFEILKTFVKEQSSSDNAYVLAFDEMSLKKNFFYNQKDDIIEGYQDHGNQGRSSQIASHALVFMLVGIRKKMKQPIAFYFSGASVTGYRLAALIKEVLHHCFAAGLKIMATVSDMDGVNRKALAVLGASVQHPQITVEGHEIITLYDTPHLLKCFRNNFLQYNIECPTQISSNESKGTGIAKWSHIQQFFDIDNVNPNFVFAPTLRQEHLNPNTKEKMRVKLAAQILSHTVAAGMFAKISSGDLPAEAVVTANVITAMDKVFDALNADSSDLRRGKPYSTNLTEKSPHLQLFGEMKKFFSKMKFVGAARPPPSLEGWVWTLNGVERLWRNLKIQNAATSLCTRRLQQDPLENLFGCIRGNCGANTRPTVGQFVAGLKTAILSNLSHLGIGNCEKDENEAIIHNFRKLIATPDASPNTRDITSDDFESEFNIVVDGTINDCIENEGEVQACAYVCGFILKKLDGNCTSCRQNLTAQGSEAVHMFVEFKEYNSLKNSLTYASLPFIKAVESCATQINKHINNAGHTINLKKNLEISSNFDFISCAEHKKRNVNHIINSTWHICIKRYCIVKNREFAQESSRNALKDKLKILKHL